MGLWWWRGWCGVVVVVVEGVCVKIYISNQNHGPSQQAAARPTHTPKHTQTPPHSTTTKYPNPTPSRPMLNQFRPWGKNLGEQLLKDCFPT